MIKPRHVGVRNEHSERGRAGWDFVHQALAATDAARREWLDAAMLREMTCDFCDARLPHGNATGHCTSDACRARARGNRELVRESRRSALEARQDDAGPATRETGG